MSIEHPTANPGSGPNKPGAAWSAALGPGRSLKPASWPKGARCAVAISFDADHETIPLRDNDESPMRISQGQYGARQAIPRIRRLLERESVPATFFYPAVSALLHPEEVRAVAERWARDRHPFLDPRGQHVAAARGGARTDVPGARHAGEDQRQGAGGDAHRELGFFGQYAGYHPRNETAVRQQADGG